MEEQDFIQEYTELMPDRTALTLSSRENHECILFDGRGCRVHPVKPKQCQGFPNSWNFPGWQQVCEALEEMG